MSAEIVGAAAYRIRLARAEEVPLLPEIERVSSARFDSIEALAGVPADPTPVAALRDALREEHVWVAVTSDKGIVGFAYACVIDRCLHLEEIDVLPAHGRRGIGAALSPGQAETVRDEERRGLPFHLRVFMRYDLDDSPG